jgi:hypothetical protein
MTTAEILSIIEIVARHGIPAVKTAIEACGTERVTLADIETMLAETRTPDAILGEAGND